MKALIPLLVVCSLIFCGCPGDCETDGFDQYDIISNVKLDITSSGALFNKECWEKPFCYEALIKEDNSDSVFIKAMALDDTLSYSIAHQKYQDVYIVIDTIPIPSCKSSNWLAEHGGYGHYSVVSKHLYSCVFFFEPSCE